MAAEPAADRSASRSYHWSQGNHSRWNIWTAARSYIIGRIATDTLQHSCVLFTSKITTSKNEGGTKFYVFSGQAKCQWSAVVGEDLVNARTYKKVFAFVMNSLGQVTIPPKTLVIAPWIQFLRDPVDPLGIDGVSVPIKFLSQDLCFGDLRLCQFCYLGIIRRWENPQMHLIPNVRMVACQLS